MRDRYKTPDLRIGSEPAEDSVATVRSEDSTSAPRDLLGMLLILSSYRRRILAVTFAAAAVAAIVVLLIPNVYTANTSILPPEQSQSAANVLLGQIGILNGLSSSDLGLNNPADLFIAMLRSRSIQDALINQFDLRKVYGAKTYEDARKKLDQRSAILNEKEGLISISVTDRDPRRAADMANAYVDQLHSLNQSLAVSEAAQRRLFYQQKLDAEREALSQAELALKQAQEKTGLVQPDAQGRAIIDAVANTRAQVGIEEVQLQAMRTYATPNNPDLQRKEQELAGLRAELAKLEHNSGKLGNGNVEIPTGMLPEVELGYLRRARDLKYHEALYEFLNKQLEAARIDEAKEGVLVQVVDKAVLPEKKSGPHRTLIALLVTTAAFILSCFWVFVAETLRRMREGRQEGRVW